MKIKNIPGLTVSILSDGTALPEFQCYTATVDGRKHWRSGYVQATTGSTFGVLLTFEPPFQHLGRYVACRVSIDGRTARFEMQKLPNAGRHRLLLSHAETLRDGKHYAHPLRFADVQYTDDDTVEPLHPAVAHQLGTILVQLYVVEATAVEDSDITTLDTAANPGVMGPVHESSMKGRAVSLCVKFGEPIEVPNRQRPGYRIERVVGGGAFAVFTFKFRSRRDLEIEDILPPEAEAGPSNPQ